ncbi:hypothetical protein ACJJTC_017198 [Scirpophaga incertulas]
MKALIQRVKSANVAVNGVVISSIERGLCVLIDSYCPNSIRKLLNVKIFDDDNNIKWKATVVDKQYELLCVSQFTLYNTWKGNRPDFHNAMPAEKSRVFYETFVQGLKEAYEPEKIKDGAFGEYMQVSIQNDGPVTFEIESPAHINKNNKRMGVQVVPQVDLDKEDELSVNEK